MPTATAQQTTLYIAPAGDDQNPCSAEAPCATFEHVLAMLVPGDILRLMNGTYSTPLVVTQSGTEDAPIMISAAPDAAPVIDVAFAGDTSAVYISGDWINLRGITAQNSARFGIEVDGQHVTVSDVSVRNVQRHGIHISSADVIVEGSTIQNTVLENSDNSMDAGFSSALKCAVGCEDVVFRGNTVGGNYGENIAVTRGINVQVLNNIIGDSTAPGIYVDNSYNVLVERNIVTCTGAMGSSPAIYIGEEPYEGWGAQLHDVTIRNNRVENCRNGVAYFGSDVRDSLLENISITGNIIHLTTNAGIFLEGLASNVTIRDNTIVQAEYLFIFAPEDAEIENNITAASINDLP